MTRLAILLTILLTLAVLPILTQPAAANDPRCDPDCRVWAWSPYHGLMWVQTEYVSLVGREDCIWFEDGSAACGEDR